MTDPNDELLSPERTAMLIGVLELYKVAAALSGHDGIEAWSAAGNPALKETLTDVYGLPELDAERTADLFLTSLMDPEVPR